MSLKNVKLSVAKFPDKIPSNKQKVSIMPFRVADEKTLLIASQSNDAAQLFSALKQVVGNCLDGADVNELENYDLEYLFLKIRAISVGETSKIGLHCEACDVANEIDVDLSTIEVQFDPEHNDLVKIEDNLAFKMKQVDLVELSGMDLEDPNAIMDVIVKSIKEVYTEEEVITIDPADYQELSDLIGSMTTLQFEKLRSYFDTMPKVVKKVSFTCGGCSHENETTLEGLQSFF